MSEKVSLGLPTVNEFEAWNADAEHYNGNPDPFREMRRAYRMAISRLAGLASDFDRVERERDDALDENKTLWRNIAWADRLAKIVEAVKGLPRYGFYGDVSKPDYVLVKDLDRALGGGQASPAPGYHFIKCIDCGAPIDGRPHGYGRCVERRGDPKFKTREARATHTLAVDETHYGNARSPVPTGRRTGRDRRKG